MQISSKFFPKYLLYHSKISPMLVRSFSRYIVPIFLKTLFFKFLCNFYQVSQTFLQKSLFPRCYFFFLQKCCEISIGIFLNSFQNLIFQKFSEILKNTHFLEVSIKLLETFIYKFFEISVAFVFLQNFLEITSNLVFQNLL